MKVKIIKIGNHNVRIQTFFDYDAKQVNQKKFIANIVKQIKPVMGYGYAGFSHKKYLTNNLLNTIFGFGHAKIERIKFPESKITDVLHQALKVAVKKLPFDKKLYVYVFPHFNQFIKDKMGGTGGTVIWKNTLMLFVNPVSGWQQYLKGSVVHEYNHSVAFKYVEWSTLLNKLILEGMAEVFLEENINKPKLLVGTVLSKEKSKKYFQKIKSKLQSKDHAVYDEVFYQNKKYPLWTGYAIGYWIVKSFRQKNPKLSWQQLIQLDPKYILKKSGF